MIFRVLIVSVLVHLNFVTFASASTIVWPEECWVECLERGKMSGRIVRKACLDIHEGNIVLIVHRAFLPETGGELFLRHIIKIEGKSDGFGEFFHSLKIAPMPHEIDYTCRFINGLLSMVGIADEKLPFARDKRFERIVLRPLAAGVLLDSEL